MGLQVKLTMICLIIAIMLSVYSCSQPTVTQVPAAKEVAQYLPVDKDSIKSETKPENDEQQFRQFLKEFKTAVKQKNQLHIATLCYFPLQTAPQWTAEDLKQGTANKTGGLINRNEFAIYYKDMFPADVIRILPASTEDDLSEIDKHTTEDYYQTVAKVVDKSGILYELQKQYEQDNGQETSFGFVFGKVQGRYKIISYYRPWPLKD